MLKETERPAWDEIGAHAALPLLEWAVEYQSPVFLLCERRKPAFADIPLMDTAVMSNLQDFLPSKWRKSCKWAILIFYPSLHVGRVTGRRFGPRNDGWACTINV